MSEAIHAVDPTPSAARVASVTATSVLVIVLLLALLSPSPAHNVGQGCRPAGGGYPLLAFAVPALWWVFWKDRGLHEHRAPRRRSTAAHMNRSSHLSTEEGCPSAALLDEIGRSSNAVRHAYSEGMLAMIDDVAGLVGESEPGRGRSVALSVFASMVGTLQIARALSDDQLSRDVLNQGIANVFLLLGWAAPCN